MTSTTARARAGRRLAVAAPLLACALVLTGCGGDAAPAESPTSAPTTATSGTEQPAPSGEPVLRVEVVGGFTTAAAASARAPVVSVYDDGRVVSLAPSTDDPAADGGAPPALPALVQRDVGTDGVAALVGLAREAGVGSGADLGDPRLADATTVRFTLRTDGAEGVTDAYALREAGTAPGPQEDPGPDGPPGSGDVLGELGSDLGPGALERRQRLADLLAALEDVGATLGDRAGEPVPYTPAVLAVLAAPARDGSSADGSPLAWPGPDLDGEALGSTDVTCTAVFGDSLAPVLDAAGAATTGAAWSWEGAVWDLSFRPLLPDETGCETVTEPATTP